MSRKQAKITTFENQKSTAFEEGVSSGVGFERDGRNHGKKVAMGLSGGVDSSVAAALLVEQGYEVTGVFLECYRGPGCRADEDRKDALAVALKLKIPFVVLDYKREYQERVLEYFYREYEAGRTPNPDTVCNREIKFGLFYEWALRHAPSNSAGRQGKQTFDYMATGHYARVRGDRERGYGLMRGRDEGKDQSYFLYQLEQEQLANILFPIGGMTKSEVRDEAGRRGLTTAKKPDSQGICFVGEVKVGDFLRKKIKPKEGEMVFRFKSNEGEMEEVVGKHEGVAFYTVGQRVGAGLDKQKLARLFREGVFPDNPVALRPMYVVGKKIGDNKLVVGFDEDTNRSRFWVRELNWLKDGFEEKLVREKEVEVWVRIRNLGELVRARIKSGEMGKSDGNERFGEVMVKMMGKGLRGVAEGQACVFYSDNSVDAMVWGGGVIRVERER